MSVRLTVVILSSWYSKNRKNVEIFHKMMNDFGISVMRFYIEDLTDDQTGRVLPNILFANPKIFICLDIKKESVEFLVKRTHIPIVCADDIGLGNTLGKTAIIAISRIREEVLESSGS